MQNETTFYTNKTVSNLKSLQYDLQFNTRYPNKTDIIIERK